MARVTALALLGAMAVGCGLDESGLGPADDASTLPDGNVLPDTGGPDGNGGPDAGDAGPTDGGPDDVVLPPVDGGPCDTDANACTGPDVPQGWSPVAYAENTQTACPAGFGPADDNVTKPTLGVGACSCSCTKTDPDCATGTVNLLGSINNCNSGAGSFTFASGACQASTGIAHSHEQGDPIASSGGSCTGQTVTNSGALTSTPARLCPAAQACASATCGGYAPAGFIACIAHDGDTTCPGSVFTVKHAVAKSAALACSSCGTGCNLTGTCDNPKFHFYTDGNCTQGDMPATLDGKCNTTNYGGTNYGSVDYTATPNFTCTATGSTTASVTYTTQRTVCCKQ